MSNKISVIVGGQFGSEGKGAIAAYLSSAGQNPSSHVLAVRVAGPNAGHTALGNCPPDCDHPAGRHPWRLRQVPVAAVTNPSAELVIAAGSEIDPIVLMDELHQLDQAGYRASERTLVDRSATVIETSHVQAERDLNLTSRLGSTGKGIGAARMARISRVASTWGEGNTDNGVASIDTAFYLNRHLVRSDGGKPVHVVIEGTQGYGLGLHTRFYPTTTSSDCRAIDFLAMAGISPWVLAPAAPEADHPVQIWVVMRTYPIRVAGNSGPLKDETTWDQLGLPQEHTTVTQKVRRVGGWDPLLAREAVEANGGMRSDQVASYQPPVNVALTMADYQVPGATGRTNADYDQVDPGSRQAMFDLLTGVAKDCGVFPTLVGTGPNTLLDLRPEAEPLPGLGAGVQIRIRHEARRQSGEPYEWAGGQQ